MTEKLQKDSLRVDERIPLEFRVGHQRLFGMLHLPLIERPVPAVLICHGLAGDKCGRYRSYVTIAKMLAQQGIACFRFDYRGSGDSEGDFSQVTVDSQIEDSIAAAMLLKNHPHIDSQRLGILGRSFGGLIATQCAVKTKIFHSICLWSAVFNGESWRSLWFQATQGLLSPEKYTEAMSINGQIANVKLWEQLFQVDTLSAVKNLTNIPLLHIHGEKDTRVDISHADAYQSSRKESQALTQFIRLPESDHDFSNPWEREEAFDASVEWFRQTL